MRCLYLYAPAEKTGLWRALAPRRFPELDVCVRGIRRSRVSRRIPPTWPSSPSLISPPASSHTSPSSVMTVNSVPCSSIFRPPFHDETFQHLAFMVDGTPKVVALAVDPDKHFIEVPAPVRPVTADYASLPDLSRERWTEPVPPVPDRLVTDVDAEFEKCFFDLAQR